MKKTVLTMLLSIVTLVSYSQNYKFGKVSKEEVNEKVYPLDSSANAAYLYQFKKIRYDYNSDDGFVINTDIHVRIKIYTKEGFDNATRKISFYKPDGKTSERIIGVKGYTFNVENGKIRKEKLSSKNVFTEKTNKFYSVKKITMPSVKVGSVIDFKYTLVSPFPRHIDDLRFQYHIPVKKLNYSVEIPEYYIFNKRTRGYHSIQVVESNRNRSLTTTSKNRSGYMEPGKHVNTQYASSKLDFRTNISTYNEENIPALKNNEPHISNIDNYRTAVAYEISGTRFPNSGYKNFSNTWKDVSKQIYKSSTFGSELNKSSFFADDLPGIISGSKNDLEKAIKIFNHVKSKVKWNGYYGKYTDQGVRKAYKKGVGNVADINLLLTAMLRKANINANPVLVSTRANGIPVFPTIKGFNYVIVSVQLEKGKILLDATEKYSAPNVLPLRVLNWRGREVKENQESDWVSLMPKSHAVEDNTISVAIDAELTVTGVVRTKLTNLLAIKYRKKKNPLKEEVIRASIEEENNVEIESFKVSNKNDITKPLVQLYKFSSEDLIEEINGKLYVYPLLFLTTTKNIFKLENRKFPVDFGSPIKEKTTVNMKFPEGYKIESIPKPIAIGLRDNVGVFKFQVIAAGAKIRIVSVLQFNTGVISPEYYQELKMFYAKLVEKQTEKIVLIKE
jgi:hypothetical protein